MTALLYSFVLNLIEIGTVFFTVSNFTDSRLPRKAERAAVWFVNSASAAVMVTVIRKPFSSILAIVLTAGIVFLVYRKPLRCGVIMSLNLVLMFLTELISIAIVSIFTHSMFGNIRQENPVYANSAIIFANLLLVVSSYILFIGKKKYYFISRKVAAFQAGLLLSGVLLFLTLLGNAYTTIVENDSLPAWLTLVSIGTLILFMSMIFMLFYKMQIDAEVQKETALETQYESMMVSAAAQLKAQVDVVRELKHNMRYHLSMMLYLVEKYDEKCARDYYHTVEHTFNVQTEENLMVSNPYITGILLSYKKITEEKQVQLKTRLFGSFRAEFAPNDLAAVLYNILENALNAVLQVEGERYISLEIKEYKNMMMIICRNPYMGTLGEIWTMEPSNGHGYGTKSVKRIAESYFGQVNINTENNIFEIAVQMFGKI